MAPLPRLSTNLIAESAVRLVDEAGFDALSLSAVAETLRVAPSALYTYCEGLNGLHNLVCVAATRNLTIEVRNAAIGTAGDQALSAMGHAYRDFALSCSGQFASTLRPPPCDNSGLMDATRALLEVFVLVYVAMGLNDKKSSLAARSTRSALHGFLALEHVTGTNDHHDVEYQHLLGALQRGLAA